MRWMQLDAELNNVTAERDFARAEAEALRIEQDHTTNDLRELQVDVGLLLIVMIGCGESWME